jgi:hypothetical protein
MTRKVDVDVAVKVHRILANDEDKKVRPFEPIFFADSRECIVGHPKRNRGLEADAAQAYRSLIWCCKQLCALTDIPCVTLADGRYIDVSS